MNSVHILHCITCIPYSVKLFHKICSIFSHIIAIFSIFCFPMSQVSRTHIEQSALPCWWPPREPDSLSDLSARSKGHYWGSSGLGIPNGTWHRKPKHTLYPRLAIRLHPATLHLMIHPRNTAEVVWKQAAHGGLNQGSMFAPRPSLSGARPTEMTKVEGRTTLMQSTGSDCRQIYLHQKSYQP